jgi:WD40 repeat protein
VAAAFLILLIAVPLENRETWLPAAPPRLDAWDDPLPPGALCRTGSGRAPHALRRPFRFSPDGQFLAAPGDDDSIQLWDAKTGKAVRKLVGYDSTSGETEPFLFSPDGKTLAAVGGDYTIHLWQVETGQELHRLAGHSQRVRRLSFSSNGRTLLSAGDDGTTRLWRAPSGGELHCLSGHRRRIEEAVLAPDGTWLASSDGEDVRCWDAATGKRTLLRPAASGHLAISPDGKQLAAPCRGGHIRLWDSPRAKSGIAFRETSRNTPTPSFCRRGSLSWRSAPPQ